MPQHDADEQEIPARVLRKLRWLDEPVDGGREGCIQRVIARRIAQGLPDPAESREDRRRRKKKRAVDLLEDLL